jgi:hypothetical protein
VNLLKVRGGSHIIRHLSASCSGHLSGGYRSRDCSGTFGTDFNQADQLFFDQIVEAAMGDDGLRQAAAVNPEDKVELVFRNLLERLFVERMDQNEEICVRYMNDIPFKDAVSTWMASEAYRRLQKAAPSGDSIERNYRRG